MSHLRLHDEPMAVLKLKGNAEAGELKHSSSKENKQYF